jgi:hypothetical protein
VSQFQEFASDLSLAVGPNAVPLAKRVLRFRILCELADGSTGLVRIVSTLAEARGACKEFAKEHLELLKKHRARIVLRPDRPRRLYFQRWIGDDQQGVWEFVDPSTDGFTFTFLDRAPRLNRYVDEGKAKAGSKSEPTSLADMIKTPTCATPETEATIRSGMRVRCELLPTRTRKGGWFAKVLGHDLSGPITNSSMLPPECGAGDVVVLKVCGVKVEARFAQLACPTGKVQVEVPN